MSRNCVIHIFLLLECKSQTQQSCIMHIMKMPLALNCKGCQKTLPRAVVCQRCFNESAVLPFIEFKARNLQKIEQIKIDDRELPTDTLSNAKSIFKLQQKRKRIEMLQRLIEEKMGIIKHQTECIEAGQNSLLIIENRNSQLNKVVKTMHEKAAEMERSFQNNTRQILIVNQKSTKIRRYLFEQIYTLTATERTEISDIQFSQFSIPILQQQVQTVVKTQSIQIKSTEITKEKAQKIIFTLEQFFRRLLLLSATFRIRLPYRMSIKGKNELFLGSKKLFVYFDRQLIQSPQPNFKLLLAPPSRKKKQGFYIDQQALIFMQVNIEVFLARTGQNEIQNRLFCISKRDLIRILENCNGFSHIYKNWFSYLLASRLSLIMEHQKKQGKNEQEAEFINLDTIQIHEILSIHSSSQEFQDEQI